MQNTQFPVFKRIFFHFVVVKELFHQTNNIPMVQSLQNVDLSVNKITSANSVTNVLVMLKSSQGQGSKFYTGLANGLCKRMCKQFSLTL